MIEAVFTRTQLMSATQLSKTDLDYALAQGLIRPRAPASGRGHKLLYGRADMMVAGFVAELRGQNVATSRIREVSSSLYEAIETARRFDLPFADIPELVEPLIEAACEGRAARHVADLPDLAEASALSQYHRLLDPAALEADAAVYLLDIPAEADAGLSWRFAGQPSVVETDGVASCLTLSVTAIFRRLFGGEA